MADDAVSGRQERARERWLRGYALVCEHIRAIRQVTRIRLQTALATENVDLSDLKLQVGLHSMRY